MSEGALFKSGHEACRFAYAFSGQQYPMTVMAKMMKGGGLGSGRGLIGLEGAAVAGTVKRHIGSLPCPMPLAIAARYEIDQSDALQHAAELVQYVIPALGTGGHNRRMILALICRYFGISDAKGNRIMLSSLCDAFQVSSDTMTRRWRSVKNRLREIESMAQVRADDAMREAGLVL